MKRDGGVGDGGGVRGSDSGNHVLNPSAVNVFPFCYAKSPGVRHDTTS